MKLKVVAGCDIDRELTLREVIDYLAENTDWQKYGAMMVELNESEFVVQISVIKKGENNEPI